MATVNPQKMSVLESAFSREEIANLRKDDKQAWRAVTGILMTIVCSGTLLGFITVVVILWMLGAF